MIFKVYNRNGFIEQFATLKEAYAWIDHASRWHSDLTPMWVEED